MPARRLLRLAALSLSALALAATPAAAHKKHEHQNAQATAAAQSPDANDAAPAALAAAGEQDRIGGMMEQSDEDRATMSIFGRMLDLLGRLHPIIIHFPLAFFPAALFTAIVGRRRPAFAKPVQFLVVAGGMITPFAALLGWFDAAGAEPGPLLTVHRWLGTAIGVAGLALAIWAWKRPWEDRRPGMVWALAAITAAIVVQGWYGGALVHGADHMNW